MKTIKKDECSYSVSNAIRTLAMVRVVGLEPTRLTAEEPKSSESTISTIPADMSGRDTCSYFVVLCFYTARETVAERNA